MHSTGQKTTTSSWRWAQERGSQERAQNAARWLAAYSEAKPSMQFACRAFGTTRAAVRKATNELNGNGHAPALLTVDDVVRWWLAVSDSDRAALVKAIGVGSAWRAIELNLG